MHNHDDVVNVSGGVPLLGDDFVVDAMKVNAADVMNDALSFTRKFMVI